MNTDRRSSSSRTITVAPGTYDARGTLSSLETILTSHQNLPGRKAVVLFTSGQFQVYGTDRERKRDLAVAPVLQASQRGFTIWPVDTGGLGARSAGSAPLLSILARDTGGESLRKTGDLSLAFKHVAEQLSCYYQVSLPVSHKSGSTDAHDLLVRLDTERFPDMWGKKVISGEKVHLESAKTRADRRKVAALLSPDDFTIPQVDTWIEYPISRKGQKIVRTRIRVPLDQLTWLPKGPKKVTTQLEVTAVVERDHGLGSNMICALSPEGKGTLNLVLKKEPRARDGVGLIVEMACKYEKDGLYVARGVVTDVEGGESGSARSTVSMSDAGKEQWAAMALRIKASSGRDYFWRPGFEAPVRDKSRQVFRRVKSEQSVTMDDRIALDYVLCGPETNQASEKLRHALVIRYDDGSRQVQQLFAPEDLRLDKGTGEGKFCTQATVGIPEYSLEPGKYEFAILTAEADPATAFAGETVTFESGVLALAPFTVR